MSDKKFIGKVFEKIFNNGGNVIKLTLNDTEKAEIANVRGETTIEVKKSLKGKWYAEISQFQQQASSAPVDQSYQATTYNDLPPAINEDPLPF